MPVYDVAVEFVFATTVRLEAPDATTAQAMVQGANSDQVAHLNGKSFADVSEVDRRDIVSVTEVT